MVYTLVVHLYAKDDQECINKLIAKLQEASQVYTNDKECLGWYVVLLIPKHFSDRFRVFRTGIGKTDVNDQVCHARYQGPPRLHHR